MIYVLTYSKLLPADPSGEINGLFEYAFSNLATAEKYFKSMKLTKEYFRKEMWAIDNSGQRKLIKEERFK